MCRDSSELDQILLPIESGEGYSTAEIVAKLLEIFPVYIRWYLEIRGVSVEDDRVETFCAEFSGTERATLARAMITQESGPTIDGPKAVQPRGELAWKISGLLVALRNQSKGQAIDAVASDDIAQTPVDWGIFMETTILNRAFAPDIDRPRAEQNNFNRYQMKLELDLATFGISPDDNPALYWVWRMSEILNATRKRMIGELEGRMRQILAAKEGEKPFQTDGWEVPISNTLAHVESCRLLAEQQARELAAFCQHHFGPNAAEALVAMRNVVFMHSSALRTARRGTLKAVREQLVRPIISGDYASSIQEALQATATHPGLYDDRDRVLNTALVQAIERGSVVEVAKVV